jgi:cytochrome c553
MKDFGVLKENKGYKKTNKEMKKRAKKLGYYASVKEVKHGLNGGKVNGKKVIVVDSRTKVEQEGLGLKGALNANLRGWNAAFNDKSMYSGNIGALYSFCRTGTDQADNIVHLQYLFQGKAKIFGLKDMAVACYPLQSKSGNVLDAKLNAKKVYVQQADDGYYYEVNCPQVKNAVTPIDVYTPGDVELAKEMEEELPKTMTMKNKKLKSEVVVKLGPDYKYYKTNVSSSANVWQKTCAICHGSKAQGNKKLNAPSLANLSKDYLEKKIEAYIKMKDSDNLDVENETMAHNMNVILRNNELSIDPKKMAEFISNSFNK